MSLPVFKPGISGAACETAFPDVFLNRNSSKIVGRQFTEGLGISSELYNDYDRIYQRCLTGYISNGDTTGTVYDDTAVGLTQEALRDRGYVLSPCPADDELSLTGDLSSIVRITLADARGKEILSTGPVHSLCTANLSPGLYFVVISGRYFSITKKLVIQH